MEIENRHRNIFLQALAIKESSKEEATIRTISPLTRLTERECELIVSSLISLSLINEVDEVLKPNTQIFLSKEGIDFIESINYNTGHSFGSFLSLNFEIDQLKHDKKEQDVAKAAQVDVLFKTHMWKQIGSYEGGAGQITRDKWFPFGSYCRKCGMQTKEFTRTPKACTK